MVGSAGLLLVPRSLARRPSGAGANRFHIAASCRTDRHGRAAGTAPRVEGGRGAASGRACRDRHLLVAPRRQRRLALARRCGSVLWSCARSSASGGGAQGSPGSDGHPVHLGLLLLCDRAVRSRYVETARERWTRHVHVHLVPCGSYRLLPALGQPIDMNRVVVRATMRDGSAPSGKRSSGFSKGGSRAVSDPPGSQERAATSCVETNRARRRPLPCRRAPAGTRESCGACARPSRSTSCSATGCAGTARCAAWTRAMAPGVVPTIRQVERLLPAEQPTTQPSGTTCRGQDVISLATLSMAKLTA